MPEKPLIILQAKVPVCPYCEARNPLLSGPTKPHNGDLAICASCHEAAMIEVDPLRLRKPETGEEKKWCAEALGQLLSSKRC